MVNQMKYYFMAINRVFGSITLRLISRLIKRSDLLISFGSWCGKQFNDNSKYLLQYLLDNLSEEYRFVWIGDVSLISLLPNDNRIITAEKNSLKAIYYLLKSQYMFCSQHAMIDLCDYNVFDGAVVTYLHHGYPIKRFGDDALGYIPRKKDLIHNIYHWIIPAEIKYDYFVSSSFEQSDIFQKSLVKHGCTKEKIISCGTPRNDLFINLSELDKNEERLKLCQLLDIDPSKKIALYLPTFRRKSNDTESLILRKEEEKIDMLNFLSNNNIYLIEKGHFVDETIKDSSQAIKYRDNYLLLDDPTIDVQELMMITDTLITDYSSAFVDYLLLDKPIVHYLYDYDDYKNYDSGLNYSVEDFGCGHVAYDFDSLIFELKEALFHDNTHEIRQSLKKRFLEYESGNASQGIMNSVIF